MRGWEKRKPTIDSIRVNLLKSWHGRVDFFFYGSQVVFILGNQRQGL